MSASGEPYENARDGRVGLRRAVAIDGPAGAGKSTVSARLAARLGWLYVDTGAMYRAATLRAVRQGVEMSDERQLASVTAGADIRLRDEAGAVRVVLDGRDVTDELRSPELTKLVRHVAACREARAALVKLQRSVADASPVVMEGRDIGTVVIPDAAAKFFLDASIDERARRRGADLARRGAGDVDLAQVRRDIEQRDRSDVARAYGPLARAADAEHVMTDGLDVEHVVDLLERHTREKLAACATG
jgi:cytidylate kinase